jgi:hypothetical protein
MRIYSSKFDSAESFDPELTTAGLVAGCGSVFCGSLVLKNRYSKAPSILDVRRSTFDVGRSIRLLFWPRAVSYERIT